ncbi:MAG: cysteine desulfurase family protein [Sphaerochaetaceae bacterium]|nr:cysteine desulfurase family protein [Sphaerochaetaceae bacterium]
MIYADNAATTQIDQEVLDSMLNYLKGDYGNSSSPHLFGRKAKEALLKARETIAKIINCAPNEIFFTSGGSESITQAILSAASWGENHNKKHIISSSIEHPAVLNTLLSLEENGFKIDLVKPNNRGIVDYKKIKSLINNDTALVSIMYANNEIGTIQPIQEIGYICRKKGVLFHSDCVQAISHLDIDVNRDNLDMISFSAHKFHGPKGVGVLYCKKTFALTPLIYGGAQERGKRGGTENIASIVAMAKALEIQSNNLVQNELKIKRIRDFLENKLLTIEDSHINGDRQSRLSSIINIRFDKVEAETLLLLLDKKNIYVSTGSACSSGSIEPSHVLMNLDLSKEEANCSIRISLSKYNSDEEVATIFSEIKEIVNYIRSFN